MPEQEQRYELVRPDGTIGSVRASKLQEAYSAGYTRESDEQYRERRLREIAGEKTGLALGAGAVRGATFGLSDMMARYAAEDPKGYAKYLKAIREENPIASTIGEIGGAAATAAIAPVASPAGIAAKTGIAAERATATAISAASGGTAKQILKQAISKGAGSAAEGAFYGAGQLLSEQALGDEELTAEKVIAHLGAGALIGGAFAGGLGLAGGATKAIGKKAADVFSKKLKDKTIRKSMSDWLGEVADESAIRTTMATGSEIKKLRGRQRALQIGRDARTYKLQDGRRIIKSGDTNVEVLKKATLAKREIGKKIGKIRKRVDDFIEKEEAAVAAKGILQKEGQKAFRPNVEKYLDDVDIKILEPLRKSLLPDDHKKAADVANSLALLRKKSDEGHKFTIQELSEFRTRLRANFQQDKPRGGGMAAPPPVHAAELERAERMLSSFVDEHVENVLTATNKNLAGKYAEAKRLYSSMTNMKKMAESRMGAGIGNRAISITDYIAGAAGFATGGAAGIAIAGAGALANKLARERGRSVIMSLAEKAQSVITAERAGIAVNKKITDTINRFLIPTKKVIGPAVTPAKIQILKEIRGEPAEEKKKTAAPVRERRIEIRQKKIERFKTHLNDITRIAANPSMAIENMAVATSRIASGAPNTASYMQQKAAQAAGYLASKAPKPPMSTSAINPATQQWEPTDYEIDTWNRYVKAVENPMSVLEDLEDGTVTHEAVDAIKSVYPKLYADIVMKTMTQIAKHEEEIPYKKRLELGIMLGVPTDASLEPGFEASMQSIYTTEPSAQEPVAKSMIRPTVGGMKQLNMSEAQITDTQRIAAS